MNKEKVVLDTSLFLANQVRDGNLDETVSGLLEEMKSDEREYYMAPSTFAELREILQDSVDDSTVELLEVTVERRPPSRYEVEIPGEMLYSFVKDMRSRVDRGLRMAEKAVRKNEDNLEEPENDHVTKNDIIISDLRDKYKEKMRKGTIDSKEDIDVLLLARELDACVVTEDQGLINWCEDLGLTYIRGRDFPAHL